MVILIFNYALCLIRFCFFYQDKYTNPVVPISRREAPPPCTRRGRGRGSTRSLGRAVNGRSRTRGKRATSARCTVMPPPSTPPVTPHQEMEIMQHEEMTTNVDLVPGDSNSSSITSLYIPPPHLYHHYLPQGMSASRPQTATAYPPAHKHSNKQNNSPSFYSYTNNPNQW